MALFMQNKEVFISSQTNPTYMKTTYGFYHINYSFYYLMNIARIIICISLLYSREKSSKLIAHIYLYIYYLYIYIYHIYGVKVFILIHILCCLNIYSLGKHLICS